MVKIGIFASIHDVESLEDLGYDERRNITLFDRFQPDVICGEVRKVDYERGSGYMGPGEYRRYIFDYCRERNIRFVPCDEYSDEDIEYREGTPEQETRWSKVMEEYAKAERIGTIPCNSREFNAIVEQKQDLQKQIDPDAHKVIWEERNTDIVNNIKAAISENPDANVLVIFGAEHAYWLKAELEKLENVQVFFPLA